MIEFDALLQDVIIQKYMLLFLCSLRINFHRRQSDKTTMYILIVHLMLNASVRYLIHLYITCAIFIVKQLMQ